MIPKKSAAEKLTRHAEKDIVPTVTRPQEGTVIAEEQHTDYWYITCSPPCCNRTFTDINLGVRIAELPGNGSNRYRVLAVGRRVPDKLVPYLSNHRCLGACPFCKKSTLFPTISKGKITGLRAEMRLKKVKRNDKLRTRRRTALADRDDNTKCA